MAHRDFETPDNRAINSHERGFSVGDNETIIESKEEEDEEKKLKVSIHGGRQHGNPVSIHCSSDLSLISLKSSQPAQRMTCTL